MAPISTTSGCAWRRARTCKSFVSATGLPFLGRGSDEDHDRFTAEMRAVMVTTAGIRRFGSASLDLAYVAAGRFDGFWEHGLKPWDVAAGIVLVREAQGVVSDLKGGDRMLTPATSWPPTRCCIRNCSSC